MSLAKKGTLLIFLHQESEKHVLSPGVMIGLRHKTPLDARTTWLLTSQLDTYNKQLSPNSRRSSSVSQYCGTWGHSGIGCQM